MKITVIILIILLFYDRTVEDINIVQKTENSKIQKLVKSTPKYKIVEREQR